MKGKRGVTSSSDTDKEYLMNERTVLACSYDITTPLTMNSNSAQGRIQAEKLMAMGGWMRVRVRAEARRFIMAGWE